ncbi:MAG: ABC transporter permease [Bacteroidota bacterium]
MHKIKLIIAREYLTRVKKKSFIIMTLVGPLLLAAVTLMPALIQKFSEKESYKVVIIDEAPKIFTTQLQNTKELIFVNDTLSFKDAKKNFANYNADALLYVPADYLKNAHLITMVSDKQLGIDIKSAIEEVINKEIESTKIKSLGLTQAQIESVATNISIKTQTLSGKDNDSELTTAVGLIAGGLIYFFIFFYGTQVMRGVIEEKTNRIIEVLISSVKPFELMLGKIVGIALVGLTQFVLWVVLSISITAFVSNIIDSKHYDSKKIEQQVQTPSSTMQELKMTEQIQNSLSSVNFSLVIPCFIFYFLGGYLFYSALFAAVGSAVDNETDTQQFIFPITIPLIFAFIVAQSVIANPHSPLAYWCSFIPFTSPVVMMVRIAFGVSWYELLISMSLLVAGFIFTTYLAGRIYRIGILMYGKKPTYQEIRKWIFYKD